MARSNPERRAALLDAAIDVLAAEGARGLTYRSVDVAAGVPAGTASNYFAGRDDLLLQAGARIHVRLAPEAGEMDGYTAAPANRETIRAAMHGLFARVAADRSSYLALLELRLEATRRPGLRADLTATVEASLAENFRLHAEGGFPGDRYTAMALYLAMTGLIVEHLTLPEAWRGEDFGELIDRLCERIVPEA
ncbi:TetR/AcrR family transcriptional regulator [Phytomonospora endophytica]|uniref:DNA-binding transcriptional regulator YbjK n=1 Tax=Phytomonospora endophytica TaxID=714109 RepID=A0A841FDW8_9ACTN|nr:TetR/AcrR family transcriptional regulator [Phytomonospora endophytica]MBB6034466.1 DNA-binding transcriptional regulator YbjK [Phytomonospora endophytica]GIG70372.1 TetR family transcriptional regulator [Phytomonospora endophytica]